MTAKDIKISGDSALIIAEIFEHILTTAAKGLSLPVVDLMRNALDEIRPQLDGEMKGSNDQQ